MCLAHVLAVHYGEQFNSYRVRVLYFLWNSGQRLSKSKKTLIDHPSSATSPTESASLRECRHLPDNSASSNGRQTAASAYFASSWVEVDSRWPCQLKEHFNVHINLLCMCFCTIPSNGHTSLSTALVLCRTGC